MSPPEFAVMLMAVMAATAVPAWAWWTVADEELPEIQPDPRLHPAIVAGTGRGRPAAGSA